MSDAAQSQSFERYAKFDAAAEAESRAEPPKTMKESYDRLHRLIDLLPQRAAIQENHIDRWLKRTTGSAIDRMEIEKGDNFTIGDVHDHALWHVRRASGIGGSEIGTIVKHFRGKKGTFTSARNLALEKLLIMAPMPSTDVMSRGIRAEPWIQKMYYEKHGVQQDTELLDALRSYRWSRFPQIVGTPDDAVFLDGGRRRVIDYKAPSADVNAEYEAEGISFDYQCQVSHYGILCEARGFKFDEMEIACFDPRYFDITSYPVMKDPDLIREIVQASVKFWDHHVMKGVLPEDLEPDELLVEEDEMFQLCAEAVFLKVLGDELGKRQKELLSRISAMGCEWHDLAEGKLDLGFASFNRSRKWDEAMLADMAASVGLETEDYRDETKNPDGKAAVKILADLLESASEGGDPVTLLNELISKGMPMTRKLDVDRLVQDLQDREVNPLPAAGLDERFLISRKKKGPDADKVAWIKDEVFELADTIEEVVSEEGRKVLQGQEDMEDDLEMNA